ASATPSFYTLSLHDALPICRPFVGEECHVRVRHFQKGKGQRAEHGQRDRAEQDDKRIAKAVELGSQDQKDEYDSEGKSRQKFVSDRKSTRLNSSHLGISYAV